MKFFDRLKSWAQALEDIEDPSGLELRQLSKRVRILEGQKAARLIAEEQDAQ